MSFAAAGATPVLVARDGAGLAQVAALTGGVPLAADLSDPAAVRTLWSRAEAAVGPISVLVNNAGVVDAGNFTQSDDSTIERTIQVNVLAPMHLALELSGQPIGTTLVELGPVPTDMLRHVKGHLPTERSFRRTYRLGLLVDIPAGTAASATVEAVRSGTPHVRLPRRTAGHALLAGAPRSASRLVLTRVPRCT